MAGTRLHVIWLIAALFAAMAGAAQAAERVMFDKEGCPWCLPWRQEIGRGYPLSDEGRRAPSRVVKLSDGRVAGVDLGAPVTLSPTFVLVEKQREVGRVAGYPGADFFYGLLAELLQKLDKTTGGGHVPSPAGGHNLGQSTR